MFRRVLIAITLVAWCAPAATSQTIVKKNAGA